MSKHLNITNFLMFLLFGLVAKACALSSLSIGEALIGITLVGYCGYMKFLEFHAAKKVEAEFETRIRNLENKMSVVGMGKSFGQRQ